MSLLERFIPSWTAIAKSQGRSIWRVTFLDGRVVAEPEVPDWMHLDHKADLARLELICPNGQIGSLPTAGPVEQKMAGEQFFQFKIASLDTLVDISGHQQGGSVRQLQAHVIGVLDNAGGDCTCFAWEPERQWSTLDPTRLGNPTVHHVLPARLYGPFRDGYPGLTYGGNAMSLPRLDLLGVR